MTSPDVGRLTKACWRLGVPLALRGTRGSLFPPEHAAGVAAVDGLAAGRCVIAGELRSPALRDLRDAAGDVCNT